MASYWDKVLDRRLNRRRALAAAGAGVAGAVILSACGGGDDEGGGGGGADLLINGKEEDTTKSAKRGGTYRSNLPLDPQNFDLYNFDPFSQPFANAIATRLLYTKPHVLKDPTETIVDGDLAQSWEISPDKLTATFKLNPAVKWAPLSGFHTGAPQSIGGRQMDSEDVLFSWDRFIATATASGADELSANRNPLTGPVTRLSAPDKTTVVFHLNKPFAPLLSNLALGSVAYFNILPKEGKGKSDAEFWFKWQFGSGPFYIDSYQPSVKMVLKANPFFRERDPEKRPFVDQVDMPIIPDPSTQVAQFRAGQTFGGGVAGFLGLTVEDVLQLKKEKPFMQMVSIQAATAVTEWFGMSGIWKDQRLRQAVQYSWDRDTWIDTIFATEKLSAAGIPTNRRYNTAIPCNGANDYMFFPGMWLDPTSKEFGENAKWVTLGSRDKDIAEAKKLLSAAGYANGLDFTHWQYPIFPGAQQQGQDLIEGMMREAGLRATKQEKKQIPEVFGIIFGKGNFPEMFNTVDFPPGDVASFLRAHYHPSGNLFGGWDENDKGVNPKGDTFMTAQVEKILAEFDSKKKQELVWDFQRYAQKMFYYSRYPGGATALSLQWPAVKNFNVFRGYDLARIFTYEWLDQTQPPFA
jgi:ABC-type transport system substrate-binding protein